VDHVLLQIVLERLDQAPLSDDVEVLAFAACEGAAELESALGGNATPRPGTADREEEVEPAGAYLGPVSVEGFRGIGPEATLGLTPGPGLTPRRQELRGWLRAAEDGTRELHALEGS